MRRTISPSIAVAIVATTITWPTTGALCADQLTVERVDDINGTSRFKVQTRLPTGWETRVGMDLGVATGGEDKFEPGIIEPWKPTPNPSALAWGTLVVPGPGTALGWDETQLDARFNTVSEEARFSATAVRRWSVGPHLSASAAGNVTMVEAGITGDQYEQRWETSRALRLTVVPTGTSIETRARYLGAEQDWHAYVTAEQSLFGSVKVTTSIGEIETGEPTLSVGTRFKRRW